MREREADRKRERKKKRERERERERERVMVRTKCSKRKWAEEIKQKMRSYFDALTLFKSCYNIIEIKIIFIFCKSDDIH
jgi:hypothetical protein